MYLKLQTTPGLAIFCGKFSKILQYRGKEFRKFRGILPQLKISSQWFFKFSKSIKPFKSYTFLYIFTFFQIKLTFEGEKWRKICYFSGFISRNSFFKICIYWKLITFEWVGRFWKFKNSQKALFIYICIFEKATEFRDFWDFRSHFGNSENSEPWDHTPQNSNQIYLYYQPFFKKSLSI